MDLKSCGKEYRDPSLITALTSSVLCHARWRVRGGTAAEQGIRHLMVGLSVCYGDGKGEKARQLMLPEVGAWDTGDLKDQTSVRYYKECSVLLRGFS